MTYEAWLKWAGKSTQSEWVDQVIPAPYEIKLPRSAREPDILYVAKANLHRLNSHRLKGPADLVVEFISPDSVQRARVAKKAEYAEAGVPEYWSLDGRPRRHRADFLQLTPAGIDQSIPLDALGRYHSLVLPGFWLDPTWLWQNPLPKPAAVMKLIVGDPR